MKKILMTLAAIATAATMNAQVWVGGEIGFSSEKTTAKSNGTTFKEPSMNNFTVAPEIGYNLNEKWAVAVKLSFAHNENNSLIADLAKTAGFTTTGASISTNAFTINPYARYTFLKAGNFSAFVDGGVSYGTIHVNHMSDMINNINAFGVGINPGITYAVSPKVSLVAHIGDVSFNTMWTKTKGSPEVKVNNNKFNFGLWNNISFGAYYNF